MVFRVDADEDDFSESESGEDNDDDDGTGKSVTQSPPARMKTRKENNDSGQNKRELVAYNSSDRYFND